MCAFTPPGVPNAFLEPQSTGEEDEGELRCWRWDPVPLLISDAPTVFGKEPPLASLFSATLARVGRHNTGPDEMSGGGGSGYCAGCGLERGWPAVGRLG